MENKELKNKNIKKSHNPKVFSYQYYQQLYDIEEYHWWSKGIREVCEKLLHATRRFNQTTNVLDIGCGTGISLSWLKNANLAGSVVQTDISKHAIQFCKRRGHDKVLLSSAGYLPFKDNSFDLAISIDVIQHVHKDDLQRTFAEAFRILYPGGSLLIRTNVFRRGHHSGNTTTYRRFKMGKLKQLAEEAGFSTERLTYANSLPALLSIIPVSAIKKRIPGESNHNDQGLHLKLPERTSVKDFIQYLILMIEAILITRINIPCGHSMILLARKP